MEKWNSKTGPIREFVGIRAKMYSLPSENKKDNKLKAKRIIKAYHQRKLWHKHFVRALRKKTTKAKFWQIRSSMHYLKAVLVNMCCLNPNDCKRYVLPNGINTLAYGHYSLRCSDYCCCYYCFKKNKNRKDFSMRRHMFTVGRWLFSEPPMHVCLWHSWA